MVVFSVSLHQIPLYRRKSSSIFRTLLWTDRSGDDVVAVPTIPASKQSACWRKFNKKTAEKNWALNKGAWCSIELFDVHKK